MQSQDNKIVYVAMSGGVDSSVAAALLKKQGYDVTGVFMRPWSPGHGSWNMNHGTSDKNVSSFMFHVACLWKEDREDALRAAAVLGVPLLTWDFSKEYKKEVGDYMLREYKAGRTPNPDVMCNKEIKFGLFLKKALKEGADLIATGHYVRLKTRRGPVSAHPHRAHYHSARRGSPSRATPFIYSLYQALDKDKDQSYFLWTLKQEQLGHCLFPIGDFIKPEVRKLAKKFGLPNHDKKDSQGVCFIGPLDMKDFLAKYIKNKKGKIMDKAGHIIGEHDGVYYYTIGQRHGLDIKNGQGPYYVVAKDLKKNIIYVGKETELGGKEAKISNISWISPTWKLDFQVKGSMEVDVKIRYRSRSIPAVITFSRSGYKLQITNYKLPFRAITPGQSAVFYRGEELLGGGVIE